MSSAPRISLSDDADREAFHATLAFLDEYDGDIDLQLPGEETHSTTSDSASSGWSPAPTTETTASEPSQSEPDAEGDSQSEATTSPSGSPSSSPAKPLAAKKSTKRRHNSHAEDPRMSAKTVEEGAYPSRTRKAELTYLKTKVQELEERLRVLKQTKRNSDDAGDGSVHNSRLASSQLSLTGEANLTTEDGVSPSDPWELALAQQRNATATGRESMWEDVAMRQFEQRQQSEIENQRLRGMLESQLKLARGLERLLKRTNADLLLPTNSIKRPRLSPDGAADASAFDELMLVVDEMYGQLETVFSDPRFAHEDAPLRDIQVDQDSALGTVVDVFDARNLPFDLRSTADAVWSYFFNTSVSYEHRQVEITEDVIKKHFNFTVEVQRHQANFRGRLAGRRFFEEDRIVILWVAMIEPEMPGSLSEGMVVRQKGWTIVKRPNKLPPNCDADAPVARIQSKHVAIPYVYEDVPDHKRKAGTLTNFVLQSVYSHLQTSRKMVENILIEGAMKNGKMDDDRRNFDATLAFLAEFQDGAVADFTAHASTVAGRTEGHVPGRSHDALVDAASDSIASVSHPTNTLSPTAGANPHVERKPRVQKPSTSYGNEPGSAKQPKQKVIRETKKKRASVTETVTTVKPLSRKDEIEFLREQVMDLEKELEGIKRPSRGDQGGLMPRVDSGRTGDDSAIQAATKLPKRIPSMWEDLASRQQQQRQSAQVENLKLKTILEDQLKVAASLQRMLKRSKNDELLMARPPKKPG